MHRPILPCMKSKRIPSLPSRAEAGTDEVPLARSRLMAYVPWAAVLTVVLFIACVRIRLLQLPLERDEGEYAYAGQLMLQGIPPYRDAFNMKFPGVYAAYAVNMGIFGQTIAGIHLGFLVWNVATILLVFLLGRRLFGAAAGAAAAAAYALMSVSLGVMGMAAHATHFVVLPVVAAGLLLLRGVERDRAAEIFLSGLFIGIGVLMKQHGIFFAMLGPVCLIRRQKPARQLLTRLGLFFGGLAVPLIVTGVVLWAVGVFGRFWFWTFTYAREYVTESSLSLGWDNFAYSFPRVVGSDLLIWIFAVAGLFMLWRKKEDRSAAVFTAGLLLLGCLAVCPGLYFREHYFVLILPALALLAGAGFRSLEGLSGKAFATSLFAAALLFPIYQESEWFFRATPVQVIRHLYSINAFAESIPVGEYVRAHTPENARIAVLGSEPQIYFYAHRRAASGYIYTYALMEPQPYAVTMQKDMIAGIEAARPEYVVLATGSATWNIQPGSSHLILDWWQSYSAQHYRKKEGIAEILSSGESVYHWGNIQSYDKQSDVVLIVFKRTD
jgi:4-amino-4-deoxy-L-arabinose transferase-like glycosyltransferase